MPARYPGRGTESNSMYREYCSLWSIGLARGLPLHWRIASCPDPTIVTANMMKFVMSLSLHFHSTFTPSTTDPNPTRFRSVVGHASQLNNEDSKKLNLRRSFNVLRRRFNVLRRRFIIPRRRFNFRPVHS